MYPKITFITVVRNDEAGLRKTLENIEDLHYPIKEVVVIDGKSTDGTMSVVEEYVDFITYFSSEEDSGIYDAMNKGIKAATGQFLWFVNAGDTVEGIDELVRLFTTDNFLADIYYGETRIVDENGKVQGLRRKKLPKKLTVSSLKNGMVVCHQSFIMRRSITPLYDLSYKYSSDYDWMIECVRRAKSSIRVDAVLSVFALGGTTTKHHKASLRERYSIMCKHFGVLSTWAYHIKFLLNAVFCKKYR